MRTPKNGRDFGCPLDNVDEPEAPVSSGDESGHRPANHPVSKLQHRGEFLTHTEHESTVSEAEIPPKEAAWFVF